MQIILNSIEELKDICSLIGGTKFTPEQAQSAPVEDKKEEPTKVDAEVTGVDTTSTEPPTDAEANEENSDGKEVKITSALLRALCSKVVKAGKSAEVKNIVSKYGAAKLPDLKEDCYADVYKDVEALL